MVIDFRVKISDADEIYQKHTPAKKDLIHTKRRVRMFEMDFDLTASSRKNGIPTT